MRSALTAVLAALLIPTTAALADTRVELLGRAADNGFRFYSPGTPWSSVRVGEYVYTTFTVTGPGIDITQPIDHQIQPLVQANVFNIVDGLFSTRIADTQLNTPVTQTTDPILGPITNPAALLAHFYYQVDTLDLEGAFMPWEIGACCFADGSCQTFNNAQCVRGANPGTWTSGTTCDTVACPQPSGVCCGYDDSCSITTFELCNGYWATGVSCGPGSCPQYPGSCCNSNGSCAVSTYDQCAGADQVWTAGGICNPNPCQTLFIPGYAMDIYISHLIPRPQNTPVAWSTADFASIPGTYPGSLFDNSRSWLISFVGTDHLPYEMFVDIQRMVVSDDSTPTGACCPGDGHCFVGTQAICGAGAWTTGGTCSPSPCPTSAGACCYANGTCDLVTPSVCAASANAVYQGDTSSCATASCGSAGACCTDGSCAVLLQSACSNTGGTWLGASTTCAVQPQHANAFSITAGSCCNGSSCSVYASQYQCTSGTWRPGTTCNDTVCGSDGACCNSLTGACVMATNGATGCNGGTWQQGVGCTPIPCPSTGSCCNASTLTCVIQNQASCLSGSGGPYSWSATDSCAVLCSGASGNVGKCCSDEFGSCTLETQAGCATHWGAASMSWTAGQVCDAACVLPITYLHGPSTTPTLYPLTLTDSGTVSEVEVWVDLYGPRASDLFLELVAPNGAAVPLFNRIGASNCTGSFVGASSGVDGSYRFLDSAAQSIAGYVGASTSWAPPGDYQPAGCGGAPASLNALAGQPIAGTWSLRVTDYRGDIRMYLRSWSISFNGGNPAPCTLGRCNLPQGGCIASTYAQCLGSWSVGSCTVTTCAGGASPGACCYLNACSVVCASQCPSAASGGRYAGDGTACGPALCDVACCAATGSCTITSIANCPGSAGVLGSTCSPNTCPQPAACCGTLGACTMMLPSLCASSGGTVGSSTCTPNTCPGQLPPPDNDVCAAVLSGGGGSTAEILLSNGEASVAGTLYGATSDGVAASCAPAAADVWYRFTPPVSAPYVVTTCGTNLEWDSVVSVWIDCTTQLAGACADSGCAGGSLHAKGTFSLDAGTPYLIRVSAYSAATINAGNFTLGVQGQGACCVHNSACYTGVCVIASPSGCSGVHQGLGTTCSPNPCPQELGICCEPSFQCVATCAAGCDLLGGTFGGIGTTCGATSPCPIGVCCRGATCAMIPQGSCVGAYQYFYGIDTCNAPGVTTYPCCYADYNKLNGVGVQDIFDFLNDWFAGSKFAVVGGDGQSGTLSVQNIFDFLNAWFAGGC